MRQLKNLSLKSSALVSIFILFCSSCSIIDDNDIKSKDDLNTRLQLTKITLSQEINSSLNSLSAGVGIVTSNSDNKMSNVEWQGVSVHSNTDPADRAFLAKFRFNYYFDQNDIDAPSLNNAIITTNITYNSSGYPDKMINVDKRNGHEFETYSFAYNSQNELTQLITYRASLNGTINSQTTHDLKYNGVNNNIVESITVSTVNLNNMSSTTQAIYLADDSQQLLGINFQGGNSNYSYDQLCGNEGCYIYGPDFSSVGNPAIKFSSNNDIVQEIELIDQREGSFGESFAPNRNPDYFFFHPLIIFPNLFKGQPKRSQAFLFDWWKFDNRSDQNGKMKKDEKVFVNYQYTVK